MSIKLQSGVSVMKMVKNKSNPVVRQGTTKIIYSGSC